MFQGTIFFHYVQESDFKDNALYTCAAYNQELKEYKVGHFMELFHLFLNFSSATINSILMSKSGMQQKNVNLINYLLFELLINFSAQHATRTTVGQPIIANCAVGPES